MNHEREQTPPPGITASLRAGFEFTSRHPGLLILPVALDCLYWIGPRIQANALLGPWFDGWRAQIISLGILESEALTPLANAIQNFNLTSQAAVPFLGAPALMAGFTPAVTPINPAVVQLTHWGQFAGVWGLCLAAGLALGALYFTNLTQLLLHGASAGPGWGRRLARNIAQFFYLALTLALTLLAVYIPFSLFIFFLTLVAPGLVLASGVLASGLLMWLVVFLGFTLPALLVEGHSAPRAVWRSVQMIRRDPSQSILMLALVLLIGRTVALLWRLADSGSWLTLVSIIGQAFIMTALLSALFIFYAERARRDIVARLETAV